MRNDGATKNTPCFQKCVSACAVGPMIVSSWSSSASDYYFRPHQSKVFPNETTLLLISTTTTTMASTTGSFFEVQIDQRQRLSLPTKCRSMSAVRGLRFSRLPLGSAYHSITPSCVTNRQTPLSTVASLSSSAYQINSQEFSVCYDSHSRFCCVWNGRKPHDGLDTPCAIQTERNTCPQILFL